MATIPVHADGYWCPREQVTGKCPKDHTYVEHDETEN